MVRLNMRRNAAAVFVLICVCAELVSTQNAAAVFVLICVCPELVSTHTNHCAHIARSCASRYCKVIMPCLARHTVILTIYCRRQSISLEK
jgi:hypothetical protein